jgi:hypothetical protein
MKLSPLICCLSIAAAVWLAPAEAQAQLTVQDLIRMGYEPVQRTVEDTGPLRKSLKKPEPGLANPGEVQGQMLWRKKADPANPNDPNAGKLYLFSRGKIVEYDRGRYATTRRGQIVPLRPENAKFHIGAPMAPNAAKPNRVGGVNHPNAIDASVTTQPIQTRLTDPPTPLIGFESSGAESQNSVTRSQLAADRANWLSYNRIRMVNHQGVLDSLDRALNTMKQ